MDATEEIKNFLERNNLAQYYDSFLNLGYDDLPQLLEMSAEDLTVVIAEVGLVHKPGHRKRFVAALQMLNSKSKNGEPSHFDTIVHLAKDKISTDMSTCKFYILYISYFCASLFQSCSCICFYIYILSY